MDFAFPFLSWLSVLVVAGTLIAAAVSDFRTLTIPNWIPLAAAAFYVPFAYTLDITATALALHYGIGALLYLMGLGLVSLRIIGGGDTKLLAAISVWTGPDMTTQLLLLVAVLGGILALVTLCLRKILSGKPDGLEPRWLNPRAGTHSGIPYGIAIAMAGLILIGQITGLK
ncbi:MAG: prepilin peptidase [Rhodospirillales bacterium]|nr:prepilin peptidase [Rhodospirillales bacterium]